MLSLIKLPLSVAVLAMALAPAVESTTQRWIPREAKMENMVVDLGGDKFSTSGSQCKLQGTFRHLPRTLLAETNQ